MNREGCKTILNAVEKHKEVMEWYADGGELEVWKETNVGWDLAINPTFPVVFKYRKKLNIHQDVKDLVLGGKHSSLQFEVTPQESKELQTFLFNNGYCWGGYGTTDISHIDAKYIYADLGIYGHKTIHMNYEPLYGREVYKINEPILSETDKKIKELEDKIQELKQIREKENGA